jgi:hypothetical protein
VGEAAGVAGVTRNRHAVGVASHNRKHKDVARQRNPNPGLSPWTALELACRVSVTPGLTRHERYAGYDYVSRLLGRRLHG